jgi:hypothetical protein
MTHAGVNAFRKSVKPALASRLRHGGHVIVTRGASQHSSRVVALTGATMQSMEPYPLWVVVIRAGSLKAVSRVYVLPTRPWGPIFCVLHR